MSGGLTILGDTSGSIALVPATVAGSTTITIAAQSGTLNVGGPAFQAYYSGSQTITNLTFVKVVFNVENFDTNNNYSTSTGTFTPTVAGYYSISALCSYYTFGGSNTTGQAMVYLYKNGSAILTADSAIASTSAEVSAQLTGLVYANGTTDYFEVYARQNNGGNATLDQTLWSNFSAFLARTA